MKGQRGSRRLSDAARVSKAERERDRALDKLDDALAEIKAMRPFARKAGYVKKPKRPTGDRWREALFDFGQLLRAEFGPRHTRSPELEKTQRLYVTRGFACLTPQAAIEAVRQHFGRPSKSAPLAI
jgi:hypothetical protein